MQGAARVPARFELFSELQQLIHTGRVGDSALHLEAQLDAAFKRIVATYGAEPSFQPYLAYVRDNYMQPKRASIAISQSFEPQSPNLERTRSETRVC